MSSSGVLAARRVKLALAAVVLAGLAARLYAWQVEPAVHSDEFFQALEPAWWHLTGFGLQAWEWNEGVRSWILPGFHGALMALLMSLGVASGPSLGLAAQLFGALLNLAVVGAAFRGGSVIARRLAPGAPDTGGPAGWQGGLLAALLCALFPTMVAFSPHTLSELPSMLAFTYGIVLVAELPTRAEGDVPGLRGKVIAAGLLLSLGACIRIANGPMALVAPIVLLVRRRLPLVPWLALGAALPVLAFGLCDWLTWGRFLGSFAKYIQFNIVEGRSAFFGTSPWHWYLEVMVSRGPVALGLIALGAVLGLRASWPLLAPACALLALLFTQGHKEERFMHAAWPLLLIACAGTAGALIARARTRRPLVIGAVLLGAVALLGDGLAHVRGGPGDKDRFARSWIEGQAAAGRDPRATGLLIERTFYSGGALFYGARAPQITFNPYLLRNRIFSHVLVTAGGEMEKQARDAGFVEVFTRDGAILLRRP